MTTRSGGEPMPSASLAYGASAAGLSSTHSTPSVSRSCDTKPSGSFTTVTNYDTPRHRGTEAPRYRTLIQSSVPLCLCVSSLRVLRVSAVRNSADSRLRRLQRLGKAQDAVGTLAQLLHRGGIGNPDVARRVERFARRHHDVLLLEELLRKVR